jgi:hypothetical protein
MQCLVLDEIDDRHPATADLLEDLVVLSEQRTDQRIRYVDGLHYADYNDVSE